MDLEKYHQSDTASQEFLLDPDTTDPLSANIEVSRNLGELALDSDTMLFEHQKSVFDDIVEFYKEGGREGYIVLPTGTGKTVLFVEICKSLIEKSKEAGTPSKAIILVPKIDLVAQTIGSVNERTGKRRGFAGFAPDVEARELFGQVSSAHRADNVSEGEVLVTTYNSFRNLVRDFVEEGNNNVDWDLEKTLQEAKLQEARESSSRLKAERRRFGEDETRRIAVNKAQKFIDGYDQARDNRAPHRLSTETVERIRTILASDFSDKDKIAILRKLLIKIIPLQERKDYANKIIEQNTLAQQRRKGVKAPPLQFEKMSTFEYFAHRFIRRHSRPITMPMMEISREGQPYWDSLDFQIRRSKALETNARGRAKQARINKRIKDSIGQFDLIVCDEAHRSIGTATWDAIRDYAKSRDVALLGLTATDKYLERSLEDFYEAKIREISLAEGMEMGIINPMAMFVHETNLRFSGIEIDNYGDYDYLTMKEIRNHERRNNIAVNYAKLLAEHGYGGIISTIPGNEGEHARLVAGLLNSSTMIDPHTKMERKIKARYVLGKMPFKEREEIYRSFEDGDIDWIVYVDVLREGWDSDRAKALINLRPTRSPLLAKQRQGRICRVSEDMDQVSIVIDIFDGYRSDFERSELPSVLSADVFEIDEVAQGHVVGKPIEASSDIIHTLKAHMQQPIRAHFTNFIHEFEDSPLLKARSFGKQHKSEDGQRWVSAGMLEGIYRGYMPEQYIVDLAESEAQIIRSIYGRTSQRLWRLFNVDDIEKLVNSKPEVNPDKLFVDDNSAQWISAKGCKIYLQKIAPHLGDDDIEQQISAISAQEGEPFETMFGKVRLSFTSDNSRFGLVKLYRLDEITSRLIPKIRSTISSSK